MLSAPGLIAVTVDTILVSRRVTVEINELELVVLDANKVNEVHARALLGPVSVSAQGGTIEALEITDDHWLCVVARSSSKEFRFFLQLFSAVSSVISTLTTIARDLHCRDIAVVHVSRDLKSCEVPIISSDCLSWLNLDTVKRVPFVDDRLVTARKQLLDLEQMHEGANRVASEATFRSVEERLDELHGELMRRDEHLRHLEADADDKLRCANTAEIELRRAKESLIRIVEETDAFAVSSMNELQSWRRIVSEKQSQELMVRESLLALELRSSDCIRNAMETKTAIESRQKEHHERLNYFESDSYRSMVARRDKLLSELRHLQDESVPEVSSANRNVMRSSSSTTLKTNAALRKIVDESSREVEIHLRDQRQLVKDHQDLMEDSTTIDENMTLLRLELAELDRRRKALQEHLAILDERCSTSRSGDSVSPLQRFHVAKLVAERTRSCHDECRATAARHAEIQRGVTKQLRHCLFEESVRQGSPKMRRTGTAEQPSPTLISESEDLLVRFSAILGEPI